MFFAVFWIILIVKLVIIAVLILLDWNILVKFDDFEYVLIMFGFNFFIVLKVVFLLFFVIFWLVCLLVMYNIKGFVVVVMFGIEILFFKLVDYKLF